MIQLNLLPDVKLDYIKAQRSRNLVISVSILVSLAAIALLVLLLGFGGLQKKHISDLNKDIAADTKTLQNKPDIDKILTVQNQLQSLTPLHAAKPAVANLFGYLNELTPAQVSITDFKADFTAHTATITGTADALASVNKYVDSLKFTKFTTDDSNDAQPAFSDIVLSSFGVNGGAKDGKEAVNYTITLVYDETIFDVTQKVKLSVPNLTTTRADLSQPADLFTGSPTNQGGSN